MLIIKQGNVLEATENIICHQVNEHKIMGGGLALQIARLYPKVEEEYIKYCDSFNEKNKDVYGEWQICQAKGEQFIFNCFTQQHFITRYDLVKKVFKQIKLYCKQRDLSICIPYKYGCGIANGEWEQVESILLDIFDDYDISVYRLEDNNER